MSGRQLTLALPEPAGSPRQLPFAPGALLLRGFALEDEAPLLAALEKVLRAAPPRHMLTPGGARMSVAMTSCGPLGWVTDARGYRYSAEDPETGLPWPPLPGPFQKLATRAAAAAGYAHFVPDACLVNRYARGARLTLHQDKDEQDLGAPIVSVSLGLPAVFLFGGLQRTERPERVRLEHGDVAVWGGPSRLRYHGILPLEDGEHPRLGRVRINLTFRKAG
jgi:DNA oxidative demethylase